MRWPVRTCLVGALLLVIAPEALAFSGFKGRFQGRCNAVSGEERVCGVRAHLPGARNGTRLEAGDLVFVCLGGRWRIEDGGPGCCPSRQVDVCGEPRSLPIADQGRRINFTTATGREELYRCGPDGWDLVEDEVWGICLDVTAPGFGTPGFGAPAPDTPGPR